MKSALTPRSRSIVNVQVKLTPLQSPPQPARNEPPAGVAVSVTCEPEAKGAEHVCPHSIPGTLLETVPAPVPTLVTVSV